jgi:uncharacterized protein YjbI with pentapeptide repeats
LKIGKLLIQIKKEKAHFKRICVEEGSLAILKNVFYLKILQVPVLKNSKFNNCNIKTCIFQEANLTNSIINNNFVY